MAARTPPTGTAVRGPARRRAGPGRPPGRAGAGPPVDPPRAVAGPERPQTVEVGLGGLVAPAAALDALAARIGAAEVVAEAVAGELARPGQHQHAGGQPDEGTSLHQPE